MKNIIFCTHGDTMKKLSKSEALLWNIALPGFSQLLMGQTVKGIIFMGLEFLINVNSHFNIAILYSFTGEIALACSAVNYQWLMFYPCLYMFALWDAYRSAMPQDEIYSYLPFVFGAYFLTIGLIFSGKGSILGNMFGPVFSPMLFLIPGLLIGYLIRYILLRKKRNET